MTDAKTDLKSLLKDPSLLETRAYIGGQWVTVKTAPLT